MVFVRIFMEHQAVLADVSDLHCEFEDCNGDATLLLEDHLLILVLRIGPESLEISSQLLEVVAIEVSQSNESLTPCDESVEFDHLL